MSNPPHFSVSPIPCFYEILNIVYFIYLLYLKS